MAAKSIFLLLALASAVLAVSDTEAGTLQKSGERCSGGQSSCALEPTLISDPSPPTHVPRHPNQQLSQFVWAEDPAPQAYVYRGTSTQHSNCPVPSLAPSTRPSDCAASASAGDPSSWLEVGEGTLVVDSEFSAAFEGMVRVETAKRVEAGKCDSCSYDDDKLTREVAAKVAERRREERELQRVLAATTLAARGLSPAAQEAADKAKAKEQEEDERVIPATIAADLDTDELTDHEGNRIPSLPPLSPNPAEREIVPKGPLPRVVAAIPMVAVRMPSWIPARQTSPFVWKEDPASHSHVYRQASVQSHCEQGDESCMQGRAHDAVRVSFLQISEEIRPSATVRAPAAHAAEAEPALAAAAAAAAAAEEVSAASATSAEPADLPSSDASDVPVAWLEEGSSLQAQASTDEQFVNAPVCCYAKHIGNKWVAGFTTSSGGCKDAQQEASRLTRTGAQGVTQVKFMGLFQHFYASQDSNRACEVVVNNMNRKLLSMETHDQADVGGCVGDCGLTPRGLFCCYAVKDQTSSGYRYLGNIATQHSGCMSAMAHYNMRKGQRPGNSAIGTPHYTAEYHVCRGAIDTLQDCARFASKFGRIDPPMQVDGKAL